MINTDFFCLPTSIGSMPHRDTEAAHSQITRYLKDIPAWPQLPKRSPLENMVLQYSEGFPGVVIEDGNLRIERSQDMDKSLEKLYAAYLAEDASQYPMSPDYAAGLYRFLSASDISPRAVKGQISGPVTWGLMVTDENRRAIIYDEVLGDAVPRFLRLKAAWQESKLKEVCKDTIIFVDEPYLASFGSVSMTLSRENVINLLEEVFGGISGLKGIHCCGNTDWSVVLDTSVNILSFDAYGFAQSLSLYPEAVKSFLDRKGAIAWGIVPNQEEALNKESVASLKDRLEEAMAPFTRKGVRFQQLLEQSLLTPSCGLASLASEEVTARVLEMLVELSESLRKKYR
jgi:methionine synthase II (cobalamin-independent)